MENKEPYVPGPAGGATIRKEGENWTLVLTRDLRHPPEKVWLALTDPEQLRQWAPFDSDANLGNSKKVNLTWTGAPAPKETPVIRAEAPKLLEFDGMRWELEATETGTRLTLWHSIDRRYIAMGAAGWHVSIDVMGFLLDGKPVGRIVGADALRFEGWQRLLADYSKLFGTEQK